jgi:hypothetical protein
MTQLLIWAGVVVMAAYAFATVYGSWRRSGKAREGVAQMQAGRVTPVTTHCHPSESAALSASVQRYFQAALTDGQQIIATAEVTQKGTFNLSIAADQRGRDGMLVPCMPTAGFVGPSGVRDYFRDTLVPVDCTFAG